MLTEVGKSEISKRATVAADVQRELDSIQGQGGS